MNGTLLFLICFPLAWIVFLTFIARWEKRMVWPYGPPQSQRPYDDDSGYSVRWIQEACNLGFTFLGWAPDMKGPKYRVSYAFLASPDRDCLIVVGVGDIMKLKLRGTWVYTVSVDGNVLYSTDNQSCLSLDVSRRWRTQQAPASTLAGLLERHRDLCQRRGLTPRHFSTGRELDEFKALREEHYQAQARMGLITFDDPMCQYWHYSLYGAAKWAVLSYTIGLLRAMTRGTVPRCA